MGILHGLVLFLGIKLYSSTEVDGIIGNSATLVCPNATTSGKYQWQKYFDSIWSQAIIDSAKYEGANTKSLTINNLIISDSGTYRCTRTSDGIQGYVTLKITVNGNWGQWSAWTQCTRTCGIGTTTRYRLCNNPTPANNGADCTGNAWQSLDCSTAPCPVNGNWGIWTNWICSVTCGNGTSARQRSCNNPVPAYGGNSCFGDGTESKMCVREPCPVHGIWGTWGPWLMCSVTCNGGKTTRQRSCENPVPAYNGSDCEGNSTDRDSCSVIKCPDFARSETSVGGIIGGPISACVVIFTVAVTAVIIFYRRRRKNTKKPNDYDVTDMKQGEEHVYSQNRGNHNYCNTDLRSPIQLSSKEGIQSKYGVTELSNLSLDKYLLEKKLQEEFQWLMKNRPQGTDYEVVNVNVDNGDKSDFDTYVKTAILQNHHAERMAVVADTPDTNTVEIFWTLINNFRVQDIIVLVQKDGQIANFFPTTEETVEMQGLEVKMISAGRDENNIFLYTLELIDKKRKTVADVRLYKTINWKIGESFSNVSTLCKLISKCSDSNVLMTGSKGNGYRMCGVLHVCLDVINAIKDDKKFSILQFTLEVVKARNDLFQTYEEYELCYNILRHYIEHEHCYVHIYSEIYDHDI